MRRLLRLAAACSLCAAGCKSFDGAVFDERLRGATFDAYVETIETQFGGLEPAGISVDELRARYRSAAVGSATPAAFYAVLRALLADLDDPHAGLTVSPRFWNGPVAEPEWIQFVELEGVVHAGLPRRNVRGFEEAVVARAGWLADCGVLDISELSQEGAAVFLRSSAAFGARHPGGEDARLDALAEPLSWLPLIAVDGVRVESAHDAELLVRGALGSIARLEVPTASGGSRPFGAVRNAGVFEGLEPTAGLRQRLHPLELAERLDPAGAILQGSVPTARAPIQALRAQRRWYQQARRGPGDSIGADLLSGDSLETFRVEARRLVTPAGHEVAFLRLGSFRWSLEEPLAEIAELFRDERHWIIDLTGNPGGAWAEAGLFMSYFLPPDADFVPHEVRSSRERAAFFTSSRVPETHRLRRAEVPHLRPQTVHVLVDQDTASAGEIVAAFLRGSIDAVLVGERTAGAEFSTGDFQAPDGSVLSIGLGGGMVAPLPHFQGRGLEVDVEVGGATRDLEAWRAAFALHARSAALAAIDGHLRAE